MSVLTYDFVGESAYVKAVDDIRKSLDFLHDDDYAYDMAINEAVLNAALYSVAGPDAAKIHIDIRFTNYDIITTVSCETHWCDMLEYRDQLRSIVSRPEYLNMDWMDYVGDTDASRGLWYMLSGTEYIVMDRFAQFVSLHGRNPCATGKSISKMRDLLMRFFVEKDGVLL